MAKPPSGPEIVLRSRRPIHSPQAAIRGRAEILEPATGSPHVSRARPLEETAFSRRISTGSFREARRTSRVGAYPVSPTLRTPSGSVTDLHTVNRPSKSDAVSWTRSKRGDGNPLSAFGGFR